MITHGPADLPRDRGLMRTAGRVHEGELLAALGNPARMLVLRRHRQRVRSARQASPSPAGLGINASP
jgi:hypothetical protein